MSMRDDGTPHAAQSIRRMRTLMRSMLSTAERQGLIDTQPWPAAGAVRAVTRITKAVDTASLPEPPVVAAMLDDVITHQPASHGYRVLLACMYYAGLRPGEALALEAANVKLPHDLTEWGTLQIRQAKRSSSSTRWTAEDEAIGDPKVGSVRDVPIPPVLCEILNNHLDGRRTGLLVSTRNGTPTPSSTSSRSRRSPVPVATPGVHCPPLFTLRPPGPLSWSHCDLLFVTCCHRQPNSSRGNHSRCRQ